MLEHLASSEDWQRKGRLEKGFTLVELLVVVIILGILAAVVVFAVGTATEDAAQNACENEERTVASAIEAYRAREGSYPAVIDDVIDTTSGFLRDTPQYWTTTGGGNVTPVAATNPAPGDCTNA